MNRKEILDKVDECVCGQREQDYRTPKNNFEAIKMNIGIHKIDPTTMRAADLYKENLFVEQRELENMNWGEKEDGRPLDIFRDRRFNLYIGGTE